ncbi:sensor histidine kinase [Cryobacterium adonitolivorans]|uniref:Sensor histidine kinase n=1 Tax=Cryobacterium adonitolivorans TaxID=1259189 RepID=A0A4R8WAL6_9MICO|nr:sensor histidine kinase [Cryobacterium adonitolivorans]TFC05782.1 sensor histidine kinase [Cryobacterium adonitolivorans]
MSSLALRSSPVRRDPTPPASIGEGLGHSALTPVFAGLRIGLHVLIAGLTGLVIVRSLVGAVPNPVAVVSLALVFLASYVGGSELARRRPWRWVVPVWMAVLLMEWLALTLLAPDAAFIVFPLFFLQLHVLPLRAGIPLVLLSVLLTIWAMSVHAGLSLGATLGPLVGAAVAVAVGLGYRALLREAAERQRLIEDLLTTRTELAAAARDAGTLAERERLAREIHDTVAQGLSSIQMLLHAAESRVADPAALEHLRLARDTAAANLQETRRFIRELTPPALETQTLPGALARLAASAERTATGSTAAGGPAATRVSLHVTGDPVSLPMALETTLLRIAQGSLANVAQHAGADRAEVTLSYMTDEVALDIVDDGRGFALAAATAQSPDSFGLVAIRQRVEALGGTFVLESAPGHGTAVAVRFPIREVLA